MSEKLTTADEVIDRLGGTNAVAALLGASAKAVSHYRRRGLPAETFIVLTQALNANGLYAPPSLWRMKELAL